MGPCRLGFKVLGLVSPLQWETQRHSGVNFSGSALGEVLKQLQKAKIFRKVTNIRVNLLQWLFQMKDHVSSSGTTSPRYLLWITRKRVTLQRKRPGCHLRWVSPLQGDTWKQPRHKAGPTPFLWHFRGGSAWTWLTKARQTRTKPRTFTSEWPRSKKCHGQERQKQGWGLIRMMRPKRLRQANATMTLFPFSLSLSLSLWQVGWAGWWPVGLHHVACGI